MIEITQDDEPTKPDHNVAKNIKHDCKGIIRCTDLVICEAALRLIFI